MGRIRTATLILVVGGELLKLNPTYTSGRGIFLFLGGSGTNIMQVAARCGLSHAENQLDLFGRLDTGHQRRTQTDTQPTG